MSNLITIDGPTASGKTSLGLRLANRLGYQFIDSGSIYRAGCLYLLSNGLPLDDDFFAANRFSEMNLTFEIVEGQYRVSLNGSDVSAYLDMPTINDIVPIIGGRPEVRKVVKELQRKLALSKDTVITGRDVGTEVFPDADLKFYLSATPEIRALRRFQQQGQNVGSSYEDILNSILRRDLIDSTREVSPAREPKDAIRCETDMLTISVAEDFLVEKSLEILQKPNSVERHYPRSREML